MNNDTTVMSTIIFQEYCIRRNNSYSIKRKTKKQNNQHVSAPKK